MTDRDFDYTINKWTPLWDNPIIEKIHYNRKNEAAKKVLGTVTGVHEQLATSGKYSQENKDKAIDTAKAGQAMLQFAESKSVEDSKSLDKMKGQYDQSKAITGQVNEQVENIDILQEEKSCNTIRARYIESRGNIHYYIMEKFLNRALLKS